MGLCKDQSTSYLKELGYNVVRHPREGILPLELIGRQNGTSAWLGGLAGLLTDPSPDVPDIETDLDAAAINGQQSSKLKLGIGINVLGSLVGAMGGGNIGADASYTNARKLSFTFDGVLTDRIEPLDVDRYLSGAPVISSGPLLTEYVLGNGALFLITETIKSKRFTVKYETHDEVAAKVDVPVLQELVGGNVSVSTSSDTSGSVTYEGSKALTFGFRCLELGVLDGNLRLTAVKAGAVPLAVETTVEDHDFAILTDEHAGLLEVGAPLSTAVA